MRFVIGVVIAAAACGGDDDDAGIEPAAEEVFDPTVVRRFEVTMAASDRDALNADPRAELNVTDGNGPGMAAWQAAVTWLRADLPALRARVTP